MLTTKQTCELLNVSRPKLYKFIREEKLMCQHVKNGSRVLEFFPDSVESILDFLIREKRAELRKLQNNMERLKHHEAAWGEK